MQQSTTQSRKKTIYEIVTNNIIKQLEQGILPWHKVWHYQGFAQNYATGNIYTGINWIVLNLLTNYKQPYYLTWEQVQSLQGRVKKGATAEYVYFYKSYYKHPEEGFIAVSDMTSQEPYERVHFIKPLKIFNIEHVEGVTWDIPNNNEAIADPIDECNIVLYSMNTQPTWTSQNKVRSFYCPEKDVINLSAVKNFKSKKHYYSTLLKHLIHWTGGIERLARPAYVQKIDKDSPLYVEEELIAEIAVCYLCGYTGLKRECLLNNHQMYLDSWIYSFKADTKLIFRAAARAQQAVDFILGIGT